MMSYSNFVLFYFVLFFASCTKENGVYADISCSAGEMPEGEKSEVVCNFGKDIRSSKQTFMVWKYPTNTTTFDSKLRSEVLNCAWNSDPDAQPPHVCIVGEGYSYNYNPDVINYVTVDIDDVTKNQEGIYECQLVSEDSIPSSRCELTLASTFNLVCYGKGNTIACKAEDVLIFHNKDIDTVQLEIPDDSFGEGGDFVYTLKGNDSCVNQTIAVVALAIGLLVTGGFLAVGIVYVRYRFEKRGSHPEEEATGLVGYPGGPENSDSWTVDDVCRWVENLQEGSFKQYVECFRKNNVDGKALLKYNYAFSLKIYLRMGGGEDKKNRNRMMAHIEMLKEAVNGRKDREKIQQKLNRYGRPSQPATEAVTVE